MTDILRNRSVFALGETMLDMVSRFPNSGLSGDEEFMFQAVPGGSVLNASVSLGRMGADIHLISEFGNDKAGDLIDDFLQKNRVKTTFCTRHTDHKTSLALAFLDQAKNASYTFYHDTPDVLQKVNIPDFSSADILLFGSFYAVKPERRSFILSVLKNAVEAKSAIYYDLNIRKNHSGSTDELMSSYLNNISVSTVVKGSDEDFRNLFGTDDPESVYEKIGHYCKILIITCGNRPLHVFTPLFHKSYTIPVIIPVSTIGAGDNFNAGFIYGLSTTGFSTRQLENISESEIDRMVGCGIAFSTETCLSPENYISGNFAPEFWTKYI
jgi:fructokinase